MPGDYGNVNSYMWIPIVGPLVGGVIGGFVYDFFVRNVLIARGAEPDPEIEEAAETAIDEPGGAPRHEQYIAAIDQGTTSSRSILFDKDGHIVPIDQREHEQITPKAGWVEHDAKEIWRRTRRRDRRGDGDSDAEAGDVAAIGITNQRETTVVWDRETGEPVYNAIVWQDTRTGGARARVRRRRGRRPAARRDRPAALDLLLRARRSRGSSTTSTARASGPRTASCCSARWTPGCCGTSPAARTAAST